MFENLMADADIAELISPENMVVTIGMRNRMKKTISLQLNPGSVYETLDKAGIARPKAYPYVHLNLTKALQANIEGRGIYAALDGRNEVLNYYLELYPDGKLTVRYTMITGQWLIGCLTPEQVAAVTDGFCAATKKAMEATS